jgi:methyl-accepting chemotaxis protein
MAANWTFGTKLMLGFAVTIAAFLTVVIFNQRANGQLIRASELVAHTHEVRGELTGLMGGLTEAETAARGYALMGTERFLSLHQAAITSLDASYDKLRRLTSDNPNQQARLLAIRPLLDARLAEFAATLEARRTGGLEGAVARAIAVHGQDHTDQIRRLVDEMDADEEALLEVRVRAANDSAALARDLSVWGGLATVLVTLVIGWALTRALTRRIGSAVLQVQTSSTELQTAANQQVNGAREQSTAMTEISTTMTELLATSRQISDSATRVAQIAAQTGAAGRAGEAVVDQGNEATALVRRQVDLIVGHMLELGKKSHQAGAVLDIVLELAEQTNILAINAAIEAAGAGESGARFGVVADEIRKLADRVTGSTKAIRGVLDDVRGAVSVTVMATETGSKAIDESARQVEATARAFREIATLVATTADAAREIELSTKQQATAVEQVYIAISDVAQATRESEASSTQTLQTSSQLAVLSTGLTRLVQRPA